MTDPKPITAKTPLELITEKHGSRKAWTYQNGIRPGPRKLTQFREVLELSGIPKLYAQDGQVDQAMVYVKIFDPCGSATIYITEYDPGSGTVFCFTTGLGCDEWGYGSLLALASVRGHLGIGLEIDMHFKPACFGEVLKLS